MKKTKVYLIGILALLIASSCNKSVETNFQEAVSLKIHFDKGWNIPSFVIFKASMKHD